MVSGSGGGQGPDTREASSLGWELGASGMYECLCFLLEVRSDPV